METKGGTTGAEAEVEAKGETTGETLLCTVSTLDNELNGAAIGDTLLQLNGTEGGAETWVQGVLTLFGAKVDVDIRGNGGDLHGSVTVA